MWYWYFSGMMTTILFASLIANIGLAQGWIKFNKSSGHIQIDSQETAYPKLYNWDDKIDFNWKDKDSELFW